MRALIVLFTLMVVGAASAESVTVELPPASLARWYKPANERQVWLHTMFGLREAMQAVEEYSAEGDFGRAAKWADRLAELYRKIPAMVPEWETEVELMQLEALRDGVARRDPGAIGSALHKLGTTCNGCHGDYQALAAALYRSPDYRKVTVMDGGEAVAYPEAMERLGRALNRVKIGLKDGPPARSRIAIDGLRQQLTSLKGSCAACHRDGAPAERILGAETERLLGELAASIDGGDLRGQGRLLGEIGVGVCARCHGAHRTLADLRRLVSP